MKRILKHAVLGAMMLVTFAFVSSAAAQEKAAAEVNKNAVLPPAAAPAGNYGGYSMMQVHAFPNFSPTDKDLFKLMFDRIDNYRYGDDYFFLGVNSDYSEDWSANTETLYFKYAGNLSYKKVTKRPVMQPLYGPLGDVLASVQVNSGDLTYLRTVWLGGFGFDIAGLPNYGRLRFYTLVRKEDTQDLTHQITMMWVQPFSTGNIDWVFNGWAAHWSNDEVNDVIKIEPQLRLKLSSFLNKENIFYNSMIGAELEIGYNYLADPDTYELLHWKANPSVFFAMPF